MLTVTSQSVKCHWVRPALYDDPAQTQQY